MLIKYLYTFLSILKGEIVFNDCVPSNFVACPELFVPSNVVI